MEILKKQMDVEFPHPKYFKVNFKVDNNLFLGSLWNRDENYEHALIIADKSIKGIYPKLPQILINEINSLNYNRKQGKWIIADTEYDNSEVTFTKNVFLFTNKLTVNENILKKEFAKHRLKLHIRDEKYRQNMKPDVFLCHDSRDKNEIAEPLYNALTELGLKVWFDMASLEIGDSLTEKIDEGIKTSKYGIVLLSKNLLSNEKWTKYELQSFKIKQIFGETNTILPIWHGINENDLLEVCPWLLDKLGGNTDIGIKELADKLFNVIRKNAS